VSGSRKARGHVRTARFWRETLLNVGAALGVFCLLTAAAAAIFGLTPLVFRSGSMSPTIETGALAVAKEVPASEIGVGDIVSVTNRAGVRVTHRVESLQPFGSQVELTLKGDANGVTDAETYPVSSADRVLFSIPYAGYAVGWATGPIGIFVGGVLVACIGFVVVSSRKRGGSRGGGVRKATALAVIAVVGIGSAVGAAPRSTMASFTDSSDMTTGSFTGLTVPGPTNIDCNETGGIVGAFSTAHITWTSAGANYSYQVSVVHSNGTSLINTTTTATTYDMTSPLLGNLGAVTVTVTVRAFPTGVQSWLSNTSVARTAKTRALGLGTACS